MLYGFDIYCGIVCNTFHQFAHKTNILASVPKSFIVHSLINLRGGRGLIKGGGWPVACPLTYVHLLRVKEVLDKNIIQNNNLDLINNTARNLGV